MKKVLKYIFLLTIFFVAITMSLTYVYKDRIIEYVIDQINSQINTPVTFKKKDISLLDQWPYISVVLHNVRIQESFTGSRESLLSANQIACALNPLDILSGDFSIHAIDLKGAHIELKINQYNTSNYLIFKMQKEATSSGIVLDLKTITLENTTVSYQNSYGNKHVSLRTEKTKASLQTYGKVFHIRSDGDAHMTNILLDGQSYLKEVSLSITADLLYNQHQRTIDINSSAVVYQGSRFDISGRYGLEDHKLTLSVGSQETTFATLSDLIADHYPATIREYQCSGEVSFQLSLDGILKKQVLPPVQLVFSLENSTIVNSKHHTQMENLSLKGYYQNTPGDSLSLAKITGDLNQKPFNSSLSITNFKKPKINLAFNGSVEGTTLEYWIELPQIDSINGEIALDFTLSGKISDFKDRQTIPDIRISGDASVAGLNITLTDRAYQLRQMEGNFIFNNNDLAISGFYGLIGESDFQFTGLIKNFLAFSMLDNEPVGVEADFSANHLNLDQLLTWQVSEDKTDQGYHFSISPQLYLKLNCDIGSLKFRRFAGQRITGNLEVKHQRASSKGIKINTMGGNIQLAGNIDAQSDSIFLTSYTDLFEIHIDSLFYVFENFNQNVLADHHLKGVVNAHIDNQVTFDHSLLVNPSSIKADINTTIIDGQLNDFKPMQKLAKYLDGDKLNRLRFEELANEIHIENQTIYLSSMKVNSNVSDITIAGSHTFNQRIDYRVVAPFNNRSKIDKDAAFGAIEISRTGQAKVFLKITGTTSDYKISYDKSAVKKEIISDLKREVQDLKDAFRKKGKKKKKEVELEEDEYFDW